MEQLFSTRVYTVVALGFNDRACAVLISSVVVLQLSYHIFTRPAVLVADLLASQLYSPDKEKSVNTQNNYFATVENDNLMRNVTTQSVYDTLSSTSVHVSWIKMLFPSNALCAASCC